MFVFYGLSFFGNGLMVQIINFYVIIKWLEKIFKYWEIYEVNIEGEKVDVFIEIWNKDEIVFIVEFIVKYFDKIIVEVDIEVIKYIVECVCNKIYVCNYIFVFEGAFKFVFNFFVCYVVRVFEDCLVYLKNYFGIVNVINFVKGFCYQGEFSLVGFENVKGSIDFFICFGDIFGKCFDGDIMINVWCLNVILEEIKGWYSIEVNYGDVCIFLVFVGLLDFNIIGIKSDIFFFDFWLLDYGYVFIVQYGSIYFFSNFKMEFLKNIDEIKKVEFQFWVEYYFNVMIFVIFGDIYFEKEKLDQCC